jgi:ribonuclease BN (tRNA processing enzyme)
MSPPSVTVLGCAGTFPGPDEACSGYLVRSPDAVTVLDLGPGTLANLQRHVPVGEVDAVVLTHEHPDHWLDLPILRNAMKHVLGLSGLAVYGPAGVRAKAEALIGDLAPTLRWTTISAGDTVAVGDQTLRFAATDHPVETLAVRVEAGGRTLAYSADTGAAWADTGAAAWLSGVDLFVCEATLPSEDEGTTQHLSAHEAGALARAGEVGSLLLTHIAPGVDRDRQLAAAEQSFAGPVGLAATHETYVI